MSEAINPAVFAERHYFVSCIVYDSPHAFSSVHDTDVTIPIDFSILFQRWLWFNLFPKRSHKITENYLTNRTI